MGNWRTVTIVGSISKGDADAARRFIELGDDANNWEHFHCPCWPGPSLCGLGRWIPAEGGEIRAVGNLAERNYTIDDVAEVLRQMVGIAPSLDLLVHCGDEWEDDTCVATVSAKQGMVTVGSPQISTVGVGLRELGAERLRTILLGGAR